MGYAEHLRKLLRPLGVYDLRPESLSGGELEALGEAFDLLYQWISYELAEALPLTAAGEGLNSWERLLGCPRLLETAEDRRQTLLGLLRLPYLGATEAALTEAAAFTGAAIRFDESLLPQKLVVHLEGVPPDAAARAEIEAYFHKLLPCHLTVEYQYS